MNTLPAILSLRQRLFSIAAGASLALAVCAANLALADSYARQDGNRLAHAGAPTGLQAATAAGTHS